MGYEEQPKVVEHATLYLFWSLLDQRVLLVATTNRLHAMFGYTFDRKQTQIHNCVLAVADALQEHELLALKRWRQSQHKTSEDRPLWGEHVHVSCTQAEWLDVSLLTNLSPDALLKNKVVNKFTMKYKTGSAAVPAAKQVTDGFKLSPELETLLNIAQKIEDELLLNRVGDMLSSKRSSEELQNELMELLGFEHFELVGQLLQERSKIAQQLEHYATRSRRIKQVKQKRQQPTASSEKRPTVASAVVVQSAQEKQLGKQQRREEKKLQRIMRSIKDDDEGAEEAGGAVAISAQQLRMQHQRKLLEAAQREPLLLSTKAVKAEHSNYTPPIRYPYVFDSQLEAKQHAGFIGGSRITLPENAQRIDNKQWEEVKIPASEPPPLTVGNQRIKIAELDDIGQLAFANCQELNRIQSVVYPVAYHSNENMLVCAPTGAGKTNVAMLAIVHTIRCHLEEGVINRDQFKIVYIAPMKALAAEMVANFSKRLKSLQIIVRELTGDMQLTKAEMAATQILVTTPEKWDVVTRKGKQINTKRNQQANLTFINPLQEVVMWP